MQAFSQKLPHFSKEKLEAFFLKITFINEGRFGVPPHENRDENESFGYKVRKE